MVPKLLQSSDNSLCKITLIFYTYVIWFTSVYISRKYNYHYTLIIFLVYIVYVLFPRIYHVNKSTIKHLMLFWIVNQSFISGQQTIKGIFLSVLTLLSLIC